MVFFVFGRSERNDVLVNPTDRDPDADADSDPSVSDRDPDADADSDPSVADRDTDVASADGDSDTW